MSRPVDRGPIPAAAARVIGPALSRTPAAKLADQNLLVRVAPVALSAVVAMVLARRKHS